MRAWYPMNDLQKYKKNEKNKEKLRFLETGAEKSDRKRLKPELRDGFLSGYFVATKKRS